MALTTTTTIPPRGAPNGTGWEGDAKGDWTDPKSSALEEWSLKKRNRQENIGWKSRSHPWLGTDLRRLR